MFATIGRIYSEGFRVFFLSAAVYGMFTGGIWLIWLISGGGFEFAGPSMIETEWHSHEMIFGYATAAVGGFFLTAVPNWTNAPAARGAFIAVVSGAWLIGRVAIWFYAALPVWLVIAADLLFVPILAAKVLSQLLKRPKPQNMVFLFILSSLWVANGLVHLEWAGIASGTLDVGMRMGLLSLCSMIAILGGRVTPAFTRNAMKRAGVPEAEWPVSRPPLEKATMILALGLPWVVTLPLDDRFVGTLAVLFGVVQILRVGLWRGAWTRAQPILWSLHLGHGVPGAWFHTLGRGALGGGKRDRCPACSGNRLCWRDDRRGDEPGLSRAHGTAAQSAETGGLGLWFDGGGGCVALGRDKFAGRTLHACDDGLGGFVVLVFCLVFHGLGARSRGATHGPRQLIGAVLPAEFHPP